MKISFQRRLCALILALGLCALLAGCGGKPGAAESAKDYAQILAQARTDEVNGIFEILSKGPDGPVLSGGYSGEMSSEDQKAQGEMILSMMGLEESDMEDYALSISMMNVKAYGVAIIRPAQGRSDAVQTALQNFIQAQQAAQEFYLEDQYKIAKDARLTQAADGSWVMVMSEDATALNDSILSALK